MVGKGYGFNTNSQMTSIDAIFTFICHTKQLNPWPNSSVNHVVNHRWLSVCQGKMWPFDEGQPSTHGCQTGLKKRPERKQTVQSSAVLNTCAIGPLMYVANKWG